MNWDNEYSQYFCDCGGATSEITEIPSATLECLQCGAVKRWNENSGQWEVLP
jgi:hypothetical protein